MNTIPESYPLPEFFLQTVLRQESLSDYKVFGHSVPETSIFVHVFIVIMTFSFSVARFRAELELITALCLLSLSPVMLLECIGILFKLLRTQLKFVTFVVICFSKRVKRSKYTGSGDRRASVSMNKLAYEQALCLGKG